MFTTMGKGIDRLIRWIGEKVTWLTTLLVVLIFTDVLMRYLFNTSKAWFTDLEWHVFALIFLLGAAYSLKEDQHVRVDVFYSKWSEKTKALVNLIGTFLFMIPWCAVVIYTSFNYAEHAYVIGERSAEPGGLPARFVIKGAISVGFVLLLLQGVVNALQNFRTHNTVIVQE